MPLSHNVNTGEGTKGRTGEGWGRLQFHHTNTTGSHISSHHDWALARLELVQDPISFILLFVAVNSWSMLADAKLEAKRITYRALAIHPDGGSE